ELDDLLGGAPAQLGVDPALHDPEPKLSVCARQVALALRPERRAPDGGLELAARHAGGRYLVEAHRDVAAEVRLNLRRQLGCEAPLGPVVDASERDAVFVDARDRVAKREDLEASAVGEDRPVPRHEAVEPTEVADELVSRAEVQVVGV